METGTAIFDLVVIGAGSGGVRAARMAAQAGKKVAVVERAALGGTCVNLGCIPKKLYAYAAHYAADFADAAGFGWHLESAPRFDWTQLQERRRVEITRLNQVYQSLLQNQGVQIIRGSARLSQEKGQVLVDDGGPGLRLQAQHILLASGGRPQMPDAAEVEGIEHALHSDQIFDLSPFPQRLLVVGGGYIACEFACIFHGLGAQVTLAYRGEQILRGFDDDLRDFLAKDMRRSGLDLRLHTQPRRLEKTASGKLEVDFADGTRQEYDAVLYATGRVPNTAGLGLEQAGIALQANGAVQVDAHFQSSRADVYAVGDLIARLQLTPVALAEAMVLVDQLYGTGQKEMDYKLIPTAVFTTPNLATVGLSEAQARAAYANVKIFSSEFKPLKHTLSGNGERCLMKLVVDADSDKVLGLHMAGADAGEIVQGFAVALKAGATKAVFDATIGIHPTAAEEFVTMRNARA